MTSNTPLGKAVKGACEELDALGDLVGRLGWLGLPRACGAKPALESGAGHSSMAGCSLCIKLSGVPIRRLQYRPDAMLAVCRLAGRQAGACTRHSARCGPAPCPKMKPLCRHSPLLRVQERQTLEEAEGLLKKLGFKSSLFSAPPLPQQQQPEDEGAAQ